MANIFKRLFSNNTAIVTNEFVEKQPQYGDHIRVCRKLHSYAHHGIYASDNQVYHFNGEPGNLKDAKIVCTTLEEFLDGGTVQVKVYNEEQLKKKFSPEEVVKNAKRIIEKGKPGDYNLIFNNCEDFANLCVFGERGSKQRQLYAQGVTGFLGGALTLLGTLFLVNRNKR